MEGCICIVRRHDLDAITDLVQGGLAREPAFGYGPLHDVEEIHSSRGEVGRRHEGDVAVSGGPVYLEGPAIKGHALHIVAAWHLAKVFVPDHDFRATRLGDAIHPDVIGEV